MSSPTRPTFAMPRLASMASEHWGLAGDLQELGSYADRNYLLTSESGARWVLKASSDTRGVVDLQTSALRHLADRPSAPFVPRVIETRDGRTQVATFDDDDRACSLWVVEFIEGQLWAQLDAPTSALREALGAALGQLDLDLADFVHPAMHQSER